MAEEIMSATETDVEIKTADGTCDAVFIRPHSGTHPGVLIWTDGFGLRPVFREMGRRLASEGYAVLVPNPYYREGKGHVAAGIKFADPSGRARLMELVFSLTTERVKKDALAYVSFLDSRPEVKKTAPIGAHGYCMGGRLTMITAATVPQRVGAGGSFHGGLLVTDEPDSPHLMVPKMRASFYFGIAEDDDNNQPDAKRVLKEVFAAAKLAAEIEVYKGALHGWCISDAQPRDGKPLYDHDKAEVAWSHLLALYKRCLA
jgi:carboxymethylenebutenolidase